MRILFDETTVLSHITVDTRPVLHVVVQARSHVILPLVWSVCLYIV